jgi:hypothetical protein
MNDMNLISPEVLQEIKNDCIAQSNNCGGCETCSQFFGSMPEYNHQETFYLICMIEARDEKIRELQDRLAAAKAMYE